MNFMSLQRDRLFQTGRILQTNLTNRIAWCQKKQQGHFYCSLHANRNHVSQHFRSMNIQGDATALEEIKCRSQKLMLLAGLISPANPGCYYYMPYTLRAMEKLIKVIDKEMHAIGGQKVDMPTLNSAALWRASGRWELVGSELLRLKDRHGQEYCLGPTHEEAITHLIASQGSLSYKQLPLLLYQVTRKFRDEPKPCFGLLRGREFYMKDMYTFDTTRKAALQTYDLVCSAYCRVFKKLGLQFVKVQAATGHIGGTMSHEFHLPADVGEDTLLVCQDCSFSANMETVDSDVRQCSVCQGKLMEKKGIEVGHTFLLGTKYSSVFNAKVCNSQNELTPVEMGCYGLGVSRILAASIEVLSQDDAIRWPNIIAPYQICLIPPKKGSKEDKVVGLMEDLYDCIAESNTDIKEELVLDDRTHLTIGKRLKDANKLGYPYIVIGGKKILDEPPLFEIQDQSTREAFFLPREGVIDFLSKIKII